MEATIPRVRLLYYFNFIASIVGLLVFNISLVNVVVAFIAMNWIGVTMTYHRYWSHRSYEFKNKPLLWVSNLFAHLSGSGSAIGWTNIHRQHHRFSDKHDDPHQAETGFWNIMFMKYKMKEGGRYVVDLIRHKYLVIMHRYYFPMILTYAMILFLINPIFVLEFFIIPSALTMFAEHLTNYVNHKAEKNYQPTNVWWMNFLSGGDGWHQNHHDFPSRYHNSNKWYEIDPTGLMIRYVFGKNFRYT